jgi:hypothetical protein
MKQIVLKAALIIAVLSAASVAKPKSAALLAPAESTPESRKHDIRDCIAQAKADVSFGKPPLDENSKLRLQGHRTEAFIRDSLPVVDRDYNPTPSKSLFARSGLYRLANLSDRYVLCLLERGYKWQE